jgi:hypothetical protein
MIGVGDRIGDDECEYEDKIELIKYESSEIILAKY